MKNYSTFVQDADKKDPTHQKFAICSIDEDITRDMEMPPFGDEKLIANILRIMIFDQKAENYDSLFQSK